MDFPDTRADEIIPIEPRGVKFFPFQGSERRENEEAHG